MQRAQNSVEMVIVRELRSQTPDILRQTQRDTPAASASTDLSAKPSVPMPIAIPIGSPPSTTVSSATGLLLTSGGGSMAGSAAGDFAVVPTATGNTNTLPHLQRRSSHGADTRAKQRAISSSTDLTRHSMLIDPSGAQQFAVKTDEKADADRKSRSRSRELPFFRKKKHNNKSDAAASASGQSALVNGNGGERKNQNQQEAKSMAGRTLQSARVLFRSLSRTLSFRRRKKLECVEIGQEEKSSTPPQNDLCCGTRDPLRNGGSQHQKRVSNSSAASGSGLRLPSAAMSSESLPTSARQLQLMQRTQVPSGDECNATRAAALEYGAGAGASVASNCQCFACLNGSVINTPPREKSIILQKLPSEALGKRSSTALNFSTFSPLFIFLIFVFSSTYEHSLMHLISSHLSTRILVCVGMLNSRWQTGIYLIIYRSFLGFSRQRRGVPQLLELSNRNPRTLKTQIFP